MKNAIKNIKQLANLWSSSILKKCIVKKRKIVSDILLQLIFFTIKKSNR